MLVTRVAARGNRGGVIVAAGRRPPIRGRAAPGRAAPRPAANGQLEGRDLARLAANPRAARTIAHAHRPRG